MGDLVVKTNQLNSAVQNLSLLEVRLIQLAIIDARETGKGLSADEPLLVSAERYAQAFDINKKNAYAIIKKTEETLFNRRFTITDSNGKHIKSRWVGAVAYHDRQGVIELYFTPIVVQHIARIDGQLQAFTKYWLKNTIRFKSVYSVRLYELLSQWVGTSQMTVKLDDLRGQLGVEPKQYKAMKDFKLRVLDRAVDEINKHSDLTASYEQVKKGRVIVAFTFTIKEKEKAVKSLPRMSDKQRKMFANKLAHHPPCEQYALNRESYEDFADRIAEELKTDEGFEFYKDYLAEVGFKM